MIEKIKKVVASDLLKVFSFTSLSSLVKLITSYITLKIVATIIGPNGIALIGQLQNFMSIFTTLGAGGINNGIVKYVAEYRDDERQLQKFLRNGLKITLLLSVFFGTVSVLLASFFSQWFLLDSQYAYVFVFFGISLILMSLNNYFLSILNGLKEFKIFVVINIITSIAGLLFTVVLVFFFQLKGALIAVVSYQSVILSVTFIYIRKTAWFTSTMLWGQVNKKIIKKYLSYSLMALVSAATVPVSQLLIRRYIIEKYSITWAGYWEGINRISAMYLLFVTTSFTVYYLPKLSEIKTSVLLRREIIKTYKIIAPIILVSLIIVFLLKDLVINVMFTKDFYPMKDFFFWQLLGDFFKVMSWVLAIVMVAKSMLKLYIVTEIVFSSLFVLLSIFFVGSIGVVGVTQAYCLNYFLYFLIMLFLFRKLLSKK